MQPPATSQLPSRGGLPAPINGVGPQRAPSGVPAGGIPRVPPVPAGAQAGYKLNANTRNAPDNQPQRAGPAITAAALANASAGEQKQVCKSRPYVIEYVLIMPLLTSDSWRSHLYAAMC